MCHSLGYDFENGRGFVTLTDTLIYTQIVLDLKMIYRWSNFCCWRKPDNKSSAIKGRISKLSCFCLTLKFIDGSKSRTFCCNYSGNKYHSNGYYSQESTLDRLQPHENYTYVCYYHHTKIRRVFQQMETLLEHRIDQ